jgi:hypothetical protein
MSLRSTPSRTAGPAYRRPVRRAKDDLSGSRLMLEWIPYFRSRRSTSSKSRWKS